ncbi:MAG: squalene--hopene cyclase [Paludisphaera borealis]|uniref:squalene--hopene cyclase n=1 Tax=Paludisphaera borealis TaxID=1387353 RepID=UPI002840297D|nr:squalene--hopene cyclase [Paludisphaera borealis]MDR3620194.1 squalene--hopene cyclase [Paludisphaera borealis]
MIANREEGASPVSADHHITRLSSRRNPLRADGYEAALDRTRGWLLARQQTDGHWVGELEGDTILESEYVLLHAFLGREHDDVCKRCARYMLERQLPEGGWAIYPGGPAEISASVKAYFALKLVGYSVDDPALVKARKVILDLGGAAACNSFTRFYLALLGQITYDDCPTVPPELVLIPSRLNFSLSAMSAWTRSIVVPLSIMSHYKPVRRIEPKRGIDDLFLNDSRRRPRCNEPLFSWARFFLAADRGLKWADRWLPVSWRRPGLTAAHRWMLEHFEDSDGLGAIFPPMIYTIVALKCLGYDSDSTSMEWAWRHLADLEIREGDTTRLQPCVSPVWDTAIATIALSDADEPADESAVERAVVWLLGKELRRGGDWQVRRPNVEPTGWHFQYANGYYPDIDDTAMVLMALLRSPEAGGGNQVAEALKRGVDWLLAMQNRDGGWAAFDVDIDNEVLTKVPFADHNAMLDPSCADITARVIELLGTLGHKASHPAVARGLEYLWKSQEPEGCWYGRWGVNYVYGTWQVLQGLKTVGVPMDLPALVKAADWLESVQQPCGGWGETCRSYDDPALKGTGEPTASQTAWAVLGLIAAGRASSEAVVRGVQYLVDSQSDDGSWDEPEYTGTGFPKVFYLKYHLYRIYFPLMAISRYSQAVARTRGLAPGALASRIPAEPKPLD